MKCPVCLNELPDDAFFCSTCKTQVNRELLNSAPTPPPPPPPPPKMPQSERTGQQNPEQMLLNRYQIRRPLKKGGMGAIYEVFDVRLKKTWALKEMMEFFVNESDRTKATERFEREATMLASLSHPNLPRVIDFFEEQGHFYLIMDFIEGEDLQSLIKTHPDSQLPEKAVIDIAISILNILEYLHNLTPPIVYRDIKPANVMVRKNDGSIVLIDFGIARSITSDDTPKTEIGTVGYAPPEQYSGHPIPVSDIYALAATMHELLSGMPPRVPFQFQPLCELIPTINPTLERIIMKALELDPARRWRDAREMKEALQTLCAQPAQLSQQSIPVIAPMLSPHADFQSRIARYDEKDPSTRSLPGLESSELRPHRQTGGDIDRPAPSREEPASMKISNTIQHSQQSQTGSRVPLDIPSQLHGEGVSFVASITGERGLTSGSTSHLSPEKQNALQKLILYTKRFRDRKIIKCHKEPVSCFAFYPGKEMIVTASVNEGIKLLELPGGRVLSSFAENDKGIRTASFSTDGRLIAYNAKPRKVPIVDLKSKFKVSEFEKFDGDPYIITFHPAESVLIMGCLDGEIFVYNYSSQNYSRLKYYKLDLSALVLSGDGNYLVAGHIDGTLNVWDLPQKKLLKTLKRHDSTITSVAFAPNNKIFISSSSDGVMHLWSCQKLIQIRTLKSNTGGITSVVFVHDNPYICTSSEDRTIRFWDLPDGELNVILEKMPEEMTQIGYGLYNLSNFFAASMKNGELITWTL